MNKYMNQTIFALSTVYGRSAGAIFRISGPESTEIAKKFCKIKKLKDRYVHYSTIYDQDLKVIDKGVIIFFKSPRSYTGEDVLELHVHGSVSIIKKITKFLSSLPKVCPASPGEFSKRAFMNGKGSALYFEGINNLINSETENQRLIANKQIFGNVSQKCTIWRNNILEIMALIDAEIEFSEEIRSNNKNQYKKKLKLIKRDISKPIENFKETNNLMHGSNIMIIGPTNVGKSSLFNLLVQEEKMIVSPIRGTTTDQSMQSINVGGKKVNIIDSAGIRSPQNIIEAKGIYKTIQNIDKIENFILVLSPDSLNKDNLINTYKIIEKIKSKKIVVFFNKSDLERSQIKFSEWKKKIPGIKKFKSISISCIKKNMTNDMLIKIFNFLNNTLLTVDTKEKDYYFSEVRQHECLLNITKNLASAINNLDNLEICNKYLRDSIDNFDELFGKHSTEDQLGFIFKNFCIGK